MKKQLINFSWPAVLSDFSQDTEKENFSRGKLKVFYKGETADHRYFSNDFAEQLIKSLPYTPVVSSYDEEKEDFVGHAQEQQIFGIVDPCTAPEFIKDENGVDWCVCDVVLYTERPDSLGKLAKKIDGHPQSLELDPSSVKYVINYDDKKHFKNIEFTAGRFVGVSVLGKDQKPAFTGSAFFSCDDKFEAKMKLLKDYCESKEGHKQNGGEKMDLKEFMELSWGDISTKVDEVVSKEYENDAYASLVDMYDNYAIFRFYYYVEGIMKLMKVTYTCDDSGAVTLGSINEVRVVYEDIPEKVSVGTNMEQEDQVVMTDNQVQDVATEAPEDEETKVSTEEVQETVEESDESKTNDEVKDETVDEETKVEETTEEAVKTSSDADSAQSSNVEITPETTMEVSVEDEQNSTMQETTTTSSTSFTDREREEFENLKRDKKVRLVNSYKDSLSDEEYRNFVDLANSDMEEDKLEYELLKAYKKHSTEKEPIRAFAFSPINEHKQESALDAFVRKNKR